MFNLPIELQRYCVQYLDVKTLKSLRMVNKEARSLSTEALFRTISLFAADESVSRYLWVLDEFQPLVRKVIFNTSSSDDRGRPSNSEKEIHGEWENAIRLVHKFENLSEVELKFADECAAEGEDMYAWDKDVAETIDYRTRVLKRIFKSINSSRDSATKVESLSIKNLQDLTTIYDNQDFMAVRGRLKKLALCIATETAVCCTRYLNDTT